MFIGEPATLGRILVLNCKHSRRPKPTSHGKASYTHSTMGLQIVLDKSMRLIHYHPYVGDQRFEFLELRYKQINDPPGINLYCTGRSASNSKFEDCIQSLAMKQPTHLHGPISTDNNYGNTKHHVKIFRVGSISVHGLNDGIMAALLLMVPSLWSSLLQVYPLMNFCIYALSRKLNLFMQVPTDVNCRGL